MVKILSLLFLSLCLYSAYGSETPKAVMEASREKGIKLSVVAQKNIGLRTEKLVFKGQFLIPATSLVHTKDKTGVYCLRDGWFKFVEVTLLSTQGPSLTVSSKELTPAEIIVVAGAALLRVSEMEAFSSEE